MNKSSAVLLIPAIAVFAVAAGYLISGPDVGAVAVLVVLAMAPLFFTGFISPYVLISAILVKGAFTSTFLFGEKLYVDFGSVQIDIFDGVVMTLLLVLGLIKVGPRAVINTIRSNSMIWAYVAFAFGCGFTLLSTPAFGPGVRIVVEILCPLAAYIIVQSLDEDHAGRLINLMLGVGLVTTLINLVMIIQGTAFRDFAGVMRLAGPMGGPSPCSFFYATMLWVAIGKYVVERKFRYVILSAMFTLQVILAMSRITLGMVILEVVVLGFLSTYRARTMALLALLIPVLILMPQEYNRFLSFQNGSISLEMTDSGRLYFWAYGLEQGFKSLWVGSGIGSTFSLFEGNESIGEMHNEFLRTFLEAGLLGFVPLVGLAFITIGKMARNVWRLKAGALNSPVRVTYAIAAILAAVLYFSTMATDNTFYYFQQFGIYVWILIGLASKFGVTTTPDVDRVDSPTHDTTPFPSDPLQQGA